MPSFPNTGILDNFNRPDENPLTVASSGDTWETTSWISYPRNLTVVSNQCQPAAVGAGVGPQTLHGTYGPDCEIYVTIPTFAASNIQFLMRGNVVSLNNTFGYIGAFIGGAFSFGRTNGGGSFVGFGPSKSISFQDGDSVGFSLVGTLFTAWWKPQTTGLWQPTVQANDSTYSAAGKFGLKIEDPCILDDLGGGTLQEPGTVLLPLSYTQGLR